MSTRTRCLGALIRHCAVVAQSRRWNRKVGNKAKAAVWRFQYHNNITNNKNSNAITTSVSIASTTLLFTRRWQGRQAGWLVGWLLRLAVAYQAVVYDVHSGTQWKLMSTQRQVTLMSTLPQYSSNWARARESKNALRTIQQKQNNANHNANTHTYKELNRICWAHAHLDWQAVRVGRFNHSSCLRAVCSAVQTTGAK